MTYPPINRIVDTRHIALCLVVDRSGSMGSMSNQVNTSTIEYLDEQCRTKLSDNWKMSAIMITYDHLVDEVCYRTNLDVDRYVSAADEAPRDMPTLYDAIAVGLDRTTELVQSLPKIPPNVIIFVLPDGYKDASKRWSQNEIAAAIKYLNGAPHNWEFYFAAANQNAIINGLRLNTKRKLLLSMLASCERLYTNTGQHVVLGTIG